MYARTHALGASIVSNRLSLLTPSRAFAPIFSVNSAALLFSSLHLSFVPISPNTMALVHCVCVGMTSETLNSPRTNSISRTFPTSSLISHNLFTSSLSKQPRRLSLLPKRFCKLGNSARAQLENSEASLAAEAFTQFKHILFPVTDRNPYLSEGTRQAAATTAALAKKYGADITVVVIDEGTKESLPEHENLVSSVRWHLSEGGFKEFGLMERLGEGKKPTAIIGEVADDMNMDVVVISMEAIHSKYVDANLLAEFIPCPVLLLPL